MIQASVNRGSRLGAKSSVQGKPRLGAEFFKCLVVLFSFEKKVEFLEFFGFT